ncbi:hypothetical protein PG994_005403 [Apiospora phragmitis]|uniref:Uncharacterized protein n=1 Tax=Apiospora phragmitis TaxID=2905665 RepID=A0ABR1VC60_9PEZI
MSRVYPLYAVLGILLVLVSLAHQSPLIAMPSEKIDTVINRAIQSRDIADLSTPLINASELGNEFDTNTARMGETPNTRLVAN